MSDTQTFVFEKDTEMTHNQKYGKLGEKKVCRFLKRNGYKIVNRNYRTKNGEIDIIACKNHIIAFVEVKTRAEGMLVSGLEAVDWKKQKKIILTSKQYMLYTKCKFQPRFDVADVTITGKTIRKAQIEYYENAFGDKDKFSIL